MTKWIDVIASNALAHGEHVLTVVDGLEVAVFNLNGEFFAIEDVCSHDGTEIASGEVDGDEIVCPRHGARFCIKTGEVKCPPAYEDIPVFSLRVVDGRIQIAESSL